MMVHETGKVGVLQARQNIGQQPKGAIAIPATRDRNTRNRLLMYNTSEETTKNTPVLLANMQIRKVIVSNKVVKH